MVLSRWAGVGVETVTSTNRNRGTSVTTTQHDVLLRMGRTASGAVQPDVRVHTYDVLAGPESTGLAASQLGRSYAHLTWIVAVSQSETESLAPVNAIGWYLVAVMALTLGAVLLLALWFSVRIEAPSLDEDMRLVDHAPVSHVGDVDELPMSSSARS